MADVTVPDSPDMGDPQVVARLRALAARWEELRADADAGREDLVQAVREAHAAGLTPYRIAQIIGVSQPTVARWLD